MRSTRSKTVMAALGVALGLSTLSPSISVAQFGYYPAPPIAKCPTGTVLNFDGTCLIRGGSLGHSSTSWSGHRSYHTQPYSVGYGAHYPGRIYAPCPTGTTAQPDGTCLISGFGLGRISYGSTYHSGYHSGHHSNYHRAVAPCPPGTVQQGSLSCHRAHHGLYDFGFQSTLGRVSVSPCGTIAPVSNVQIYPAYRHYAHTATPTYSYRSHTRHSSSWRSPCSSFY